MKAAQGLLLLLGLLTLLAGLSSSKGRKEKPGKCPKPPPGTVTTCDVTCKNDWQCPGRQKCCPYACRIACYNPV